MRPYEKDISVFMAQALCAYVKKRSLMCLCAYVKRKKLMCLGAYVKKK